MRWNTKLLLNLFVFLSLTLFSFADELIVKFKPSSIDIQVRVADLKAQYQEIERVIDLSYAPNNIKVLQIRNGDSNTLLAYLEKNPLLEYAHQNYNIRLHSNPTPNDTFFNDNITYFQDYKLTSVWSETTTGSSQVIVAVLDSGVDPDHPDLMGRCLTRDWYDFGNNDNLPEDFNGHGTHVSGIIGANGNNNIGIAGIDWNCRLLPIKVFTDSGSGSSVMVINGIYYAVDKGAKIINLSLGFNDVFSNPTYFEGAIQEAIDYAYSKGVIIVASAGNSSSNITISKVSPVCNDGNVNKVIGVASLSSGKNRSSFSNNSSKYIDISAFGEDVLSTYVITLNNSIMLRRITGNETLNLFLNDNSNKFSYNDGIISKSEIVSYSIFYQLLDNVFYENSVILRRVTGNDDLNNYLYINSEKFLYNDGVISKSEIANYETYKYILSDIFISNNENLEIQETVTIGQIENLVNLGASHALVSYLIDFYNSLGKLTVKGDINTENLVSLNIIFNSAQDLISLNILVSMVSQDVNSLVLDIEPNVSYGKIISLIQKGVSLDTVSFLYNFYASIGKFSVTGMITLEESNTLNSVFVSNSAQISYLYRLSNGYIQYSGTSMAAPAVSGIIALLLSLAPDLSPAQVIDYLKMTAEVIISTNGELGAGLIRADNLLSLYQGTLIPTSTQNISILSFYNYPNPIETAILNNNATTFYADFTKPITYAKIYIYSITGRKVHEMDVAQLPSTHLYHFWDLRTTNFPLPAGPYIAVLKATIEGKELVKYHKVLFK